MFRIRYDASKILKKDRERLLKDPSFSHRIRNLIERLAEDPFSSAFDIKKLEPKTDEAHRLRIGDYRVIFSVDFGNRIIIVHRIAKRGEIYAK